MTLVHGALAKEARDKPTAPVPDPTSSSEQHRPAHMSRTTLAKVRPVPHDGPTHSA
eukprot:CAMPEP_0170750076 /NCGR_PEP_ID=MMETSP0437-20130122/10732_1 /TAXON_ID=0 /ORGANISM="Sexangularia sp." /LENGTH=55 /DNA_ID=CAMNT_0011089035 /DNA_START=129 /DNA_END=292 /DNA_ORIENTATION=-